MIRLLVLGLFSMFLQADTLPGGNGVFTRDSSLPELYGSAADSFSGRLAGQLAGMTSPALEARKAARLRLQRIGYASVLAEVLRDDGLSAFLCMARMNSQLAFSLSHRQLFLYVPVTQPANSAQSPPYVFTYESAPWEIPLKDNWSMPEDPWRR